MKFIVKSSMFFFVQRCTEEKKGYSLITSVSIRRFPALGDDIVLSFFVSSCSRITTLGQVQVPRAYTPRDEKHSQRGINSSIESATHARTRKTPISWEKEKMPLRIPSPSFSRTHFPTHAVAAATADRCERYTRRFPQQTPHSPTLALLFDVRLYLCLSPFSLYFVFISYALSFLVSVLLSLFFLYVDAQSPSLVALAAANTLGAPYFVFLYFLFLPCLFFLLLVHSYVVCGVIQKHWRPTKWKRHTHTHEKAEETRRLIESPRLITFHEINSKTYDVNNTFSHSLFYALLNSINYRLFLVSETKIRKGRLKKALYESFKYGLTFITLRHYENWIVCTKWCSWSFERIVTGSPAHLLNLPLSSLESRPSLISGSFRVHSRRRRLGRQQRRKKNKSSKDSKLFFVSVLFKYLENLFVFMSRTRMQYRDRGNNNKATFFSPLVTTISVHSQVDSASG